MDDDESTHALIPRQLVPQGSEPTIPVSGHRVLERDARGRTTQGISPWRTGRISGTPHGARRIDRAAGRVHGARRSRSFRSDVVAANVAADAAAAGNGAVRRERSGSAPTRESDTRRPVLGDSDHAISTEI